MPAEFFLDTNIFVYSFDRREPDKRTSMSSSMRSDMGYLGVSWLL